MAIPGLTYANGTWKMTGKEEQHKLDIFSINDKIKRESSSGYTMNTWMDHQRIIKETVDYNHWENIYGQALEEIAAVRRWNKL